MNESGYRCQFSRISGIARAGIVLLLSAVAAGCGAVGPYRAYSGDRLPVNAVATLEGSQYLRQDWLNRYIDAVRFAQVDGEAIINSVEHERVEIKPGAHEIAVYFYWDMGSARGLAPALVSYAAARESLSRILRFEAVAGEVYRVMAEPQFSSDRQDITTLSHVDFWVEDSNGAAVVSRARGSYPLPTR